MENGKKNSKVVLIIAVAIVLLLLGGGILYFTQMNKAEKPNRVDNNTIVNKYTAYVKINPSIKLEYSQTCTKKEDGTLDCAEPVVDDYELINDDAENIFKNVDLFKEGKTLDKVLEVIVDKVEESKIEFSNVEIVSDWVEINTYIETTTKDDETTYNYSVNVTTPKVIEQKIENDEKAEEERKTSTTTTTKKATTVSTVIDLSKNVLYSHNMFTYVCKEPGCFSDSLINSIKKNKGTYVHSANNDEIKIAYITKLSDPYNDKKFKGTAPISKIEAAGGEQEGGAGGSDEPLTMEECKQFHLSCK